MIEVRITYKGGKELAKVTIENMCDSDDADFGDYSVRFAVDTGGGSLAIYQRSIHDFPRKKFNVLGLLRLALSTLDEEELTLDADPDARHSSGVGRKLSRSLWPF